MQEIQEIPIAQIKLDPTQPRKYLDEKQVSNIAKSIPAQGIINPIEIDKNYIIVTGEMRYRAAIEAGLETVPCKIIKIGRGRFERQVIENIHHNTMSAWDTAKALKKLLAIYGKTPPYKRDTFNYLASKVGRSSGWVSETLALLGVSNTLKTMLKKDAISKTFVRELDFIPAEYKKILEKKIANGQIPSRDMVRLLRTTMNDHPEKADELVNLNLKGKTNEQARMIIEQIAKTKQVEDWEENDYFERLDEVVKKLKKLLAQNPLGESTQTLCLNEFSKAVVKSSMLPLPNMIKNFVHSYDSQAKITTGVIEGEVG